MFLRGTIYAVIHQNNINLRGKMAADVKMDADFDGTSLNVSLMFLSVAICVLIGQFMTFTEEAQETTFSVDDFHPDVSDKTAMSL